MLFIDMWKLVTNMKDYHKNKESSYSKYWDANNSYGWAQKLSVDGFK